MNLSISLRPAYRKAAALGLLGTLSSAVFALVIAPVIDSAAERRKTVAQLSELLTHYRAAAGELPALKADLAALERHRSGEGGYLAGANETLAAAALQARIKAAVLDGGGSLHSLEMLAPENENGLRKISVRGRAAVTIHGVQQVLFALNETDPVLFFEAIDVQAPDRGGSGGENAARPLELDFTVYGYLGRQG